MKIKPNGKHIVRRTIIEPIRDLSTLVDKRGYLYCYPPTEPIDGPLNRDIFHNCNPSIEITKEETIKRFYESRGMTSKGEDLNVNIR